MTVNISITVNSVGKLLEADAERVRQAVAAAIDKREVMVVPCDCRGPAPSKSLPSPLARHYQCLGCRGWVSMVRIMNENIKLRD